MEQGLSLTGAFVGMEPRSVAPREGGRQFAPFTITVVRLQVNGAELQVDYRPGTAPVAVNEAQVGELVTLRVAVRDVYKGLPQFTGLIG